MTVIYQLTDSAGTHPQEVTYTFSHTISESDFGESSMETTITLHASGDYNTTAWISFVLAAGVLS